LEGFRYDALRRLETENKLRKKNIDLVDWDYTAQARYAGATVKRAVMS